jgi:hypothetical protein
MQDWLEAAGKLCNTIDTFSTFPEIHKARTKTLACRVKILFDTIASLDQTALKIENVATKGYLFMLMATFEEISLFFVILQKKDKILGKRVKRFGSDEESFSKWTETLQTCSTGLELVFEKAVFDAELDLRDFNQDMEALQLNLAEILVPVLGKGMGTDSIQKLLLLQQASRNQYKTQQAIKAEKTFDPKLLRYEEVIGRGGIICSKARVWRSMEGKIPRRLHGR